MSATLITAMLATVLVFWALGAYNRLVRLRGHVARSLQALAAQWQAQAQAVGVRLEQYAQGRETESQWATLDDDALRWRPLTLAARQFLACLAVLQAKPQQIAALDDVSSVRAARDIFESNWRRRWRWSGCAITAKLCWLITKPSANSRPCCWHGSLVFL
jgi:LemA protein